MLIELSIAWVIALNVTAWLVIQLGFAWAFTRMPVAWFNPGRAFGWERDGRFYERVFRVKKWKGLLPDAAAWFDGGFAKGSLRARDRSHLERFIHETWRGELCHWAAMACAPIFFPWNPWWGGLIIVAYAVAANAPCILAQRYNRARLGASLERISRRQNA